MSDNQHKIKTAKNYNDMFTIHIHTEIHITKSQLHNYEYSYLIINKKISYLYLKFCRVLQHFSTVIQLDFSQSSYTISNEDRTIHSQLTTNCPNSGGW